MANKARGQISVEFEGRDFSLTLTTDAICQLEDKADKSINEILGEIEDPKRVRMKTIRLLFWAMMLDEKPDATVEDASELIDGLRGKAVQTMTDAINAAFPEPDEDAAPGK